MDASKKNSKYLKPLGVRYSKPGIKVLRDRHDIIERRRAFASVRYGMGRGIDDRIAIIVPSDKADNAKQVIKEMGLEQNVTH